MPVIRNLKRYCQEVNMPNSYVNYIDSYSIVRLRQYLQEKSAPIWGHILQSANINKLILNLRCNTRKGSILTKTSTHRVNLFKINFFKLLENFCCKMFVGSKIVSFSRYNIFTVMGFDNEN